MLNLSGFFLVVGEYKLDLDTILEMFLRSVNSIAERDVLGISIFLWLVGFVVLFLVFDVLEKKTC